MAESAVQVVLGSIGQLLREEYRNLRSIGGGIAELRDELAIMNALLLMQSEVDDSTQDHFVRECMKQVRVLAFDTEDCLDWYMYKIRRRLRAEAALAWAKNPVAKLFLLRRLAGEISTLRARAITISERHARYSVSHQAMRQQRSPSLLPASTPVAFTPVAFTTSRYKVASTTDGQVIGIEHQVNTLAAWLGKVGAEHTAVISIVGFGGVGKTTLATEVCRKVEKDFPFQAMVSVSQMFNPTRDLGALLKRVLQQVLKCRTGNEGVMEEGALVDIDHMDDDQLAPKLEESLQGKRYLIVIDDVWTVRAWEAIQQAMPDNKCGSRIIVTTRIDSVANACSVVTAHIHHMKPLDYIYSKKLFLSRVFGSMEDYSCPPDLKVVLDDILKKCGGLPLAIVSIASLLAGYTSAGSKDKWETICNSIGSEMETHPTLEGMRHKVTLSYNNLPRELKSFMMYFSIFPEDYEIRKDRLLCRWIAEGLVQEKRGWTLMEVAESYLKELVSRNMVIPKFGNDGNVESCWVHDVLLEVMVSKSLECNFVSLLGGLYAEMSHDRIRRLSIQGGNEQRRGDEQGANSLLGRGIEEVDKEHVRSFSMFQQSAHKLLDRLDKFTLLRVLDLEGCQGLTDKHARCICRLYLLKFLSLRNTDIRELPPQVGKLEHLQTLDVYDAVLGGLPETVTNLDNLEYLAFHSKRDWSVLWRLPRGLKKMYALRYIGTAILPDDVEIAKELGELEQLQSFSVYIECTDGSGALLALADSLGKLYSLCRLNICHRNFQSMNFLYELRRPPLLLRSLRIEGILEAGLPNWVEFLTHLIEITIHRTQLVGDQLFAVLWKLPNLKSIAMDNDCYRDSVIVARQTHRFPVLSNLTVYSAQYEIHFEHGSMEQLETLQVTVGDKNKDLDSIRNLPNLKKVLLIGQRNSSTSLQHAQDQLSAENKSRAESNQFEVVVRYP